MLVSYQWHDDVSHKLIKERRSSRRVIASVTRMIMLSCRADLLVRSRPSSSQRPCNCISENLTQSSRLSSQGSRRTSHQNKRLAAPFTVLCGAWQELLPRIAAPRSQGRECSSLFDEQRIQSISSAAANLFPLWLIIAALAAIIRPQLFLWFQKDYVTAGLAITMLSMGTSLTLEVSYLIKISILRSCARFPLRITPTQKKEDIGYVN